MTFPPLRVVHVILLSTCDVFIGLNKSSDVSPKMARLYSVRQTQRSLFRERRITQPMLTDPNPSRSASLKIAFPKISLTLRSPWLPQGRRPSIGESSHHRPRLRPRPPQGPVGSCSENREGLRSLIFLSGSRIGS